MALPLASYKLRFFEDHVRAVPLRDVEGRPFAGPGVDLRGDAARHVLNAAAPLRAWLEAREPGVVLRSVSVDRGRPRVIVTLEPASGEPRPRVVRLDSPFADELVAAAGELEARLGRACETALLRRAAR